MNAIRNYGDLLGEKKRLEEALRIQKELIKYDLGMLREELRPAHQALSTVSKITSSKTDNPLFRAGLAIAGDVLLKSTFIAGGGWITRLIAPIVFNKVSKIFFRKEPKPIMGLINKLIHRSNHSS